MKIDDDFKTRVSLARQAARLTQDGLAKKVGVVRRQIAAYEAGDSKPRGKVLSNLSAALGAPIEWLASGEGQSPNLEFVTKTVTLREIPLLNIHDPYFIQFNPKIENIKTNVASFVVSPPSASADAFAVRVLGDSMSHNGTPSFPSGSIVTFEPYKSVTDRDFVLCRFDGAVYFRQLINDQGRRYLYSLNEDYPLISAPSEVEIIGVAIHCQQELGTMRDGDKNNLNINMLKNKTNLDDSVESRLSKIEFMLEQLLSKR